MSRTIKVRRKSKHELEAMGTDGKTKFRHTKVQRQKSEARRLRQAQALELRRGGATFDEIAQVLNLFDASHAKKDVESALSRFEIEATRDVVKLDLSRLEEYIMRCTHDLRTNGNLGQIDRLMRIMEFRYRLLGINGEDVRAMQQEHGITNIHIKGGVQVVQARVETEDEFIKKMMSAVGVDPNSPTAQKYLEERSAEPTRSLPMLKGSANEGSGHDDKPQLLEDEAEILDAELVDE